MSGVGVTTTTTLHPSCSSVDFHCPQLRNECPRLGFRVLLLLRHGFCSVPFWQRGNMCLEEEEGERRREEEAVL